MGYHIPPGGLWKGDYRVLDLEACTKAESTHDVRLFRVREVFPEERLSFPVKEGTIKTLVPGLMEDGNDNTGNNSGPYEDMLAQTSHDAVPREAAHDTGGAATSARPGQDQDIQEQGQGATPATLDEWVVRGANNDRLVRIHRTPRKRMFSPQACHDIPPVPLEKIDVQRITLTNLAEEHLLKIEDCWDGSANDTRELDDFWVGETQFYLVPEKPPEGHVYVDGRITRKQATQRPENIWPEEWSSMSSKQRRLAKERWEKKKR